MVKQANLRSTQPAPAAGVQPEEVRKTDPKALTEAQREEIRTKVLKRFGLEGIPFTELDEEVQTGINDLIDVAFSLRAEPRMGIRRAGKTDKILESLVPELDSTIEVPEATGMAKKAFRDDMLSRFTAAINHTIGAVQSQG